MRNPLIAFFQSSPRLAWSLLVFVLAFAQYANTLGHDYAWDDNIVILQNSHTQQGLQGIPAHFTPRTREVLSDFTGYRPVTMSSFAIDYALWGLHPFWSHLENVLFFALTCVVLLGTLRQLFPRWPHALQFLVVLLFIVHPLHVEAVANVKSRDEIFALLFGLSGLSLLLQHGRQGSWLKLLGACTMTTLAALSKENGILIVPIMVVCAFFLVGDNLKTRLLQSGKAMLPGLSALLVIFLLTGNVPGRHSEVRPIAFMEDISLGNSLAVPMTDLDAFANSLALNARYVGKFLYPSPLTYYSGFNQIPAGHWSDASILLMSLLSLLMVAAAIYCIRKPALREIGIGLIFYGISIGIYLHFFGLVLSDTMADRFMFTPSVGLCIVLVAALHLSIQHWQGTEPQFSPLNTGGKLLTASLILISIPLSIKTLVRNGAWKNNLTLFETDIPKLQASSKAHYHLAEELAASLPQAQDPTLTRQRIEQHYKQSIAITPLAYYSYDGLIRFYLREKNYKAAQATAQQMCMAYPEEADPWHYLGKAEYQGGTYAEAITHLEHARSLKPDQADTWELLGRAQAKGGLPEAAMDLLEAGILRFPEALYLHDALSEAYFISGDTLGSFKPLEYLLQAEPQNPIWWKRMIGHSQVVGDDKRASYYYQLALQQGVKLD